MHIAVIRAGAMPELSMVATCDALIFEVFRKSFPDVLHQYRIYLMIDKTVYF